MASKSTLQFLGYSGVWQLALAGLVACQAKPAMTRAVGAPPLSAPTTSAAPAVARAPVDKERCGLPEGIREAHWPRSLTATSASEVMPPAGTTTLVFLPDTQYYAYCEYPHLERQSEWIWAERQSRRIAAAITLGDLTDRNRPREWAFLKASYGPLLQEFPLLLTTGNHDLGPEGTAVDRTSGLGQYFTEQWARGSGALREVLTSGSVENAFYSLNLGKVKLGVLMLEWSPRGRTVQWANDVLARYVDHRVIVATHAYLYHDDTRYDFHTSGSQKWNPLSYGTGRQPGHPADHGTAQGQLADDTNHDGEMLWNALVRKHPNIFMVVSGHVLGDGTGLLTSLGDAGNTVHQMLVNYQMLDEGGLGYLRLLEILPDGRSLRLKTYSPSLGLFSHAADQEFALQLDPPLY